MDSKKVDSLYEKWVDNAFESKSKIIVIEENGIMAGMFIYQLNEPNIALKSISATWQFAALLPEFRNLGLGKKLYEWALNDCIKEGVLSIDTTLVQKNIISQKLHEKLGFGLLNTYYNFHKWF
jgi:GNAT superfamily N-acetyltransferase